MPINSIEIVARATLAPTRSDLRERLGINKNTVTVKYHSLDSFLQSHSYPKSQEKLRIRSMIMILPSLLCLEWFRNLEFCPDK